jgi:hypothetical protein
MSQQTEKSRYLSRYSPGRYVTAVQYIIEMICEKKAIMDRVELPVQFWKRPEWEFYFKKQLRQAHKLLKQYDEKAIVRALRSGGAKGIYSLHAPWLIPLIEKEQKQLDIHTSVGTLHKEKHAEPETTIKYVATRKSFSKHVLRERLNDEED